MKRNCILFGICMILIFSRRVYAAEPKGPSEITETRTVEGDTLTKTMLLPAGQVTLIPRYEEEGNTLYILNEDSIRMRTAGLESSEGTELITVTKTITGLPDNDLERIPMTQQQGEVACELLYAIYEVTKESEQGMPLEYEALCCYGGLQNYAVDYDAAWEATMTYTGYAKESSIQSTVVEYLYEYEAPLVETGSGWQEGAAVNRELMGELLEETQEEEVPEEALPAEGITPPEREGELEQSEETEQEAEPEITSIQEEETPLGAPRTPLALILTGAVVGILLAVAVGYLYLYTAPVYGALYSGGYKRIGRARLKRRGDRYEAALSERLTEKAETENYKIKISGYIQNRSGAGVLDIRCPDGSIITRKLKDEIVFLVKD